MSTFLKYALCWKLRPPVGLRSAEKNQIWIKSNRLSLKITLYSIYLLIPLPKRKLNLIKNSI